MIRLIDITSKHIEEGVGGSCIQCPIALALQNEYKTIDVEVDGEGNLLVNKKGLLIDHSQSCDVQDFIELFDETYGVEENLCMETVQPFTLRIIER
jgi:hypothetical protein